MASPTFAIVARVTLKSDTDVPTFMSTFAPLWQHCREDEPGTISYELYRDTEDPRTLIVMERYRSEAAAHAHLSSQHFSAHGEELCKHDIVESTSLSKMHGVDAQMPFVKRERGILVFCSSRDGKNPAYLAAARGAATEILKRQRSLVYGGGNVGLMGEVSRSVLAGGGHVTGIIPTPLMAREVSGDLRSYTRFCATMDERKRLMFSLADTVLVLPGGMGTMDEFFEAVVLFQLNALRIKIGVVNTEGYYDPLKRMLHHMVEEGMVEENVLNFVVFAPTPAEVLLKLDALQPHPTKELDWGTV